MMAVRGQAPPYEMSNRARQARETRRRIVEAAARLFVRDGYAATSIAAIAGEAEVAVPTVYASLRSKANILRAVVDLTVRGDDEAAPLAARPAWKEMEGEEDPRRRLALFARLHRQIGDREAAVFAQLEAAAGVRCRGHGDARRARPAALRDPDPAGPELQAAQAAEARPDDPRGRRCDLDPRQRAHLPRARPRPGLDARGLRTLARRAAGGGASAVQRDDPFGCSPSSSPVRPERGRPSA